MSDNDAHNEILRYIEEHGVKDKDKDRKKNKTVRKNKTQKRKKSYRTVVDLHGKTGDEAVIILRREIAESKKKGISVLLVIHGQGHHSPLHEGPVLKNLVHTMFLHEFAPYIRNFRTALPRDGGAGATEVWLQ